MRLEMLTSYVMTINCKYNEDEINIIIEDANQRKYLIKAKDVAKMISFCLINHLSRK